MTSVQPRARHGDGGTPPGRATPTDPTPGAERGALAPWRALAAIQRRRWSNRLVGTILTAALGVAFLAGTLVLTSNVRASVIEMVDRATAQVDVVVRPKLLPGVPASLAATMNTGTLPEGLVGRVRAVPGVAAALPVVQGYGRLLGHDGQAIGSVGTISLAGSWSDDPLLNPYRLVEGRAPTADDEVVVDRAAATTGGLAVGDRTTVLAPDPVPVTIVGTVSFGDRDGAVGVVFVGFNLTGAQQVVLDGADQVTSILVVAGPGVADDELARRIGPELDAGAEARPNAEVQDERHRSLDAEFLDTFERVMTGFGLFAAIVATFAVHNTMKILGAARRREQALLRTIGATRRQLVATATGELLAIGVVASTVGFTLGFGLAVGLLGAFARVGVDLPSTSVTPGWANVALAMVFGVVSTLAAGLGPAWRSSSVAPVEAVRAADHRPGSSPVRLVVSAAVTASSVAVLLWGRGGFAATAAAVVGALGGTIMGLPAVAGPAARVVGAPLVAAGRVTGMLARRNVMRVPERTASASVSMLIGVTVVVAFAVLAASLDASVDAQVDDRLSADLVLSAGDISGRSGFSHRLTETVGALPGVDHAVGVGGSVAHLDGHLQAVTLTEPASLASVLELEPSAGSWPAVGAGTIAVADPLAEQYGWQTGSAVPVTLLDGSSATFTIAATYPRVSMLTDVVMVRGDRAVPDAGVLDTMGLIRLREDTDPVAARRAIEGAAADDPDVRVVTRHELAEQVTGQIGQVVALVYVMAAMAIVVAVLAIGASTSLSLRERTKELALLRLVGQTRGAARSMIRAEAVITASVGTVLGTALGLLIAWGIHHAAGGSQLTTFVVPPALIAGILLAGALAGVAASVGSARRATRVDALDAVAER